MELEAKPQEAPNPYRTPSADLTRASDISKQGEAPKFKLFKVNAIVFSTMNTPSLSRS